MTITLSHILAQEQAVFRKFSACEPISSGCTAYATPNSNLVPHWNLVYPQPHATAPTETDIWKSRDFFSRQNVNGHVMLFDGKWRSQSVEQPEYFYWEPDMSISHAPDNHDITVISDNDFETSCGIINRVFELEGATGEYFKEKMAVLSREMPSKFWVFAWRGVPCGALSAFRTPDGADFLFNASVLPEFRGKGVASAMFRHHLQQASNPVYAYSDNPIVREKMLPHLGFTRAGEAFIVSLDVYLTAMEAE